MVGAHCRASLGCRPLDCRRFSVSLLRGRQDAQAPDGAQAPGTWVSGCIRPRGPRRGELLLAWRAGPSVRGSHFPGAWAGCLSLRLPYRTAQRGLRNDRHSLLAALGARVREPGARGSGVCEGCFLVPSSHDHLLPVSSRGGRRSLGSLSQGPHHPEAPHS